MTDRPMLDPETIKGVSSFAKRLNAIRDTNLRLVYLLRICVENAILVREVNQYREARGLEPLPIYDPEKSK